MPLDALFLGALAGEISARAVGMKIDKIYQPEREEIILALRGASGSCRLLLCANQAGARAHFIEESRENPAAPPMFCMLLRKYVQGGIIRSVTQPACERILEIVVEAADEMGEIRERRLVLELIGRSANLILCDEEGRITDCIRRIDGDLETGKRSLQPGLFYRPPAGQDKQNPLTLSGEMLAKMLCSAPKEAAVEKWIIDSFAGLSPLICRELAYRAGGDTSVRFFELSAEQIAKLSAEFADLCAWAREQRLEPWLLVADKKPRDFSVFEITQYGAGYENRRVDGFSALLEEFYSARDHAGRIQNRAREITKKISTTLDRVRRKLAVQHKELQEAKDRERLRECGDLLMANLHLIGRGAKTVEVSDFYSEDGGAATIVLDPRLTPQQNAAKYYKDYTRRKNAEKALHDLITEGKTEEKYLKSVLSELSKAENIRDIEGIREELEITGYLRRLKSANSKRQKKKEVLAPREFLSSGGFTILAGRNNLQNDQLTLKDSHKNDVWLHAQHAHGTHVLIRCANDEPDDATYTEAGEIAAFYSEAREGANVAVDYTRARFVKKHPGSKPGMVTYDQYFTMYATPDADKVKALKQSEKN